MDNLHKGHRQRLKNKFKTYKDVLSDHELLEMLLGYSIPRKDTNETAHSLISKFGSLSNVFNQDEEVLKSVDGIGENTALLLNLVGYINKKNINSDQIKNASIFSIEEAKSKLINIFENAETEIFYSLFLNSQNKVVNFIKIESDSKNHVCVNTLDFTKNLILNKPKAVIIAHNHFAKYPYPSDDDDLTTAKIYSILQLYNVNFYDHIIVSGNEIYSYFYDNRLQKIKDKINKIEI